MHRKFKTKPPAIAGGFSFNIQNLLRINNAIELPRQNASVHK
jgi:hypothetical protein